MIRFPFLSVESLESRDTPTVFGTPWPDGEHLTLSFAPDGTPISGAPSNLQQLLSQLGPQSNYDVLEAFQTWAVNANLNIGLVSDNGAAFGTGRAVQGDPRFGDIRIGGVPLASDVIAITTPYTLFDVSSGDVVVNTAAGFGSNGYDLSTVLLHEAGHAFGLPDNNDPASVMYTYYQGTETGLAPADVAAIQGLYGPRQPDQYQGTTGNGTLATATPYGNGPLTADLTTPSEVEDYKFTTGLLTTGVTVQVNAAGLSLVTPNVEVLNSRGQVVASTSTTDPTNNDLSISLDRVQSGATYYVRVSAAQDNVFGVGSYDLSIAQKSLLSGVTGLVNQLLADTGLNKTLATATSLLSSAVTAGPQTHYNVEGYLGSSSDADYYRIAVPPSQSDTPVNLLVTIWGENGAILNPWVEVEDALGDELTSQVFTANGNTTILQVSGLQPGGTYYIRAVSDSGTIGAYELAADVGTPTIQIPLLGAGMLTPDAPQASGGFTLTQTAQVHLVVSATGTSGAVELVVMDADGETVATMTAAADRTRSMDIILAAGQYTVTIQATDGSSLSYRIGMVVMTDPIGAQPSDPTSNPQPTSPPPPPPPTSSSGDGTTSSSSTGSTQIVSWWGTPDSSTTGQSY
ncbi:MAG TPA: matrixin family metalloprotease [Gemmata sp.]|nr:matrixin family metalloprotease [Gemmata sp.]